MNIILYPDPRLRTKNAPVDHFDSELADVTRAMFDLMYETEGVGLAAPQVGINRKLLVFNPSGDSECPEQEVILCNPKVLRKTEEKEYGEEGCLSFPDIRGSVSRFLGIVVQAQDLHGDSFELEFQDWEARIFQHEVDHLEGILFVDRFREADKICARPLLKDLELEYRESLENSARN
ncbi:MAG: peptide deformylase [Planctomycetota bacterium]|mgnify:CR=1 FL=1|nr:peptide deformylase [Planctomycetota bacterium]